MRTSIGQLVLTITVISFASCTHGADFYALGFSTGTGITRPRLNVTEDGAIVTASSAGSGGTLDILKWTRATEQIVLVGTAPSYASVSASSDGTTIVSVQHSGEGDEPIRIMDSDVAVLSVPDQYQDSRAIVTSKDGRVAWGIASADQYESNSTLRWGDQGVTDFGDLSLGADRLGLLATSFNGDTLVGRFFPSDGTVKAFRWTEETGAVELGGMNNSEGAYGVSSDGRWTVGISYDVGFNTPTANEAVLWDGTAPPTVLSPAREGWGAVGLDVTGDGRVVVGRLYLSDDRPQERRQDLAAGIWTEASGVMEPLQDLLVSHFGFSERLTGYHLTGIYDVTDDGRYVVGHMINPAGEDEAFLVDLGLPGDFDGNETLDIADLNSLSSAIESGENELRYDVDFSNTVDLTDHQLWVKELKGTFFGDADLDGEFNSSDFTLVFLAGEYEDAIEDNSGWAEGDWNGDGDFTSSDFVTAFLDGGYELGPRGAVRAVPEPTSAWLLLMGVLLLRQRTGRSRISAGTNASVGDIPHFRGRIRKTGATFNASLGPSGFTKPCSLPSK